MPRRGFRELLEFPRPPEIAAELVVPLRGLAQAELERKRQVLLRVQAELQGDAFRAIEVDDIGVNERFGDATFDSNRLRNGLTSL